MKEMIEKWMPKIKSLLHKLFWIAFAIFLICLICQDLDSRDGGYIRPVVSYIAWAWMSCYKDSQEIANTPFASLTISKIFLFIVYCGVALFNIVCVLGILSLIKSFFEDDKEESHYDY